MVTTSTQLSFSPLGDRALLLELGEYGDAATVAQVRALADHIAQLRVPGVLDLVPALCSIGIHYDPQQWQDESAARSPYELLIEHLQKVLPDLASLSASEGPLREIPVCYEEEYARDLAELAAEHGLSTQQLIEIHSAAVYTAYMIGFAPGFAYLGPLDERLVAPRRESPRARVPAGSVAVANRYTGIYPATLPGGWHLIGRTPVRLFDPTEDPPSLLSAGDRVRFVPISAAEFRKLQRRPK